MIIPYEQLSDDALSGLIEEFVTRDGTDYGTEERTLKVKVQQVKQQIINGDVVIVFDAVTGSVNLMNRQDYCQWDEH